MRRVAINICLKKLKENARITVADEQKEFIEDEEDDNDPIYSFNQLTEALKQLPDGYRTIINLYAIEDYSHKEIAEMLDVSESTSKSQYLRAKKKLREILNPIYEGKREHTRAAKG